MVCGAVPGTPAQIRSAAHLRRSRKTSSPERALGRLYFLTQKWSAGRAYGAAVCKLVEGVMRGNLLSNLQARFYIRKLTRGKHVCSRKICRPEIYVHVWTRESPVRSQKSAGQESTYRRKTRTSVRWHVVTRKNRWW